jgi:hypothetical protein
MGWIGTVVPVVAIVLLIRGPLARYFALFLFLLSSSLSWISQAWVLETFGPNSIQYRNIYWGSELLLDLLLFFLVIWLTDRSLEGAAIRPKALRSLYSILIAVLVIPFLFFHATIFSSKWNHQVSQLLNFGACIMNLALWSGLLMTRNRDRQLLTVSAGMGVVMAGAAVTLGVRQLTAEQSTMREVANTVHYVTQIAGPAIWCWAFWPKRKKRAPAPPAPHGDEQPSPSVS